MATQQSFPEIHLHFHFSGEAFGVAQTPADTASPVATPSSTINNEPDFPNDIPESEISRLEAVAKRYTEDEIAANARRNFLRNVIHHASPARRLEGFQTNHQRRPHTPKVVDTKQYDETIKAKESLERACASCALRDTCVIDGDLVKWLDFHPYARGNSDKRRPGSSDVPRVESRQKFAKRLAKDPLAHCVPPKQPSVKKAA